MTSDSTFQANIMPQAAVDWARKCIGPFDAVQCYRQESSRTGVWKLRSRSGQHYLKLNRRRVRWGTELFVYKNWATAFGPFAPQLQGVLDDGGLTGLLLADLGGVPLREAELPEICQIKAYAKAGELCARLNGLDIGEWFGIMDEQGRPVSYAGEPVEKASSNAAENYRQILSESLSGAESACIIDATERRTAEKVIESLGRISFPSPVPTSFDYTPGNWIVDSSGNFRGLIDFENMAWGLAADPFARLLVDYFPQSRAYAEAFYAGYGGRPPEDSPEQVRIGLVLYGLYYKTQGAARGSAKDVERGRQAFSLCSD